LVRQRLGRGSFCPLAVFDFGLGNSAWDIQLELDEKLHHRLLTVPIGTLPGCLLDAVVRPLLLGGLLPMGRMGELSDIVGAVIYLENAPFVTGEIHHVDGGQSAGR
jgi:NAD(P)-dependent dehydrogenase (short-subunit alcohol dehydrogenase family)